MAVMTRMNTRVD